MKFKVKMNIKKILMAPLKVQKMIDNKKRNYISRN